MRNKKAWLLNLSLISFLIIFILNHSFSSVFVSGLGVLMGALLLLWLISLLIKNASIVDIFWGFGFVLIAWFYAFQLGFENLVTRNWVLLGIVSLWGLRLTIYLGMRNIGKPEDYRYVAMREARGKNWWLISFFQVFALQGVLIWLISSVFLPSLSTSGAFVFWDYIGVSIWLVGFLFEAVGDWQLRKFKQNTDNEGLVMDKGLWKYTRHPNYFGDATLWFGYFFLGLAYPDGIYFICCPIIMTTFLMKISGVDLLENTLIHTKPKYAEYVKNTPGFIPFFFKKN